MIKKFIILAIFAGVFMSLPFVAEAYVLSGELKIGGLSSEYTDAQIDLTFTSGASTASIDYDPSSGSSGNGVIYFSNGKTLFMTETLNWQPSVLWTLGDSAKLEVNCVEGGVTYVADITINYPSATFGEVPVIEEGAIADFGKIQNTKIYRTADNKIRLEWTYADPSVNSVDIWRLEGVGDDYSTAGAWIKAYTSQIDEIEFIDDVSQIAVGDGKNAYYRVVPAGIDENTIHELAQNSLTVGKVDVAIVPGYNLIGIPLYQQIGTMPDQVFGDQLGIKDEIHAYNGTGYDLATLLSSGWNNGAFPGIALGSGYWLFRYGENGDTSITLVGLISQSFTLSLQGGFNLIGNPFPMNYSDLAVAGFDDPATGVRDEVHDYDGTGYDLSSFLSSNVWDNDRVLGMTKGYWYFRYGSTGFDWVPSIQ